MITDPPGRVPGRNSLCALGSEHSTSTLDPWPPGRETPSSQRRLRDKIVYVNVPLSSLIYSTFPPPLQISETARRQSKNICIFEGAERRIKETRFWGGNCHDNAILKVHRFTIRNARITILIPPEYFDVMDMKSLQKKTFPQNFLM